MNDGKAYAGHDLGCSHATAREQLDRLQQPAWDKG
jgi:hypothetical protein